MRSILAILLALASATGCSQDKPIATLKYLEMHRVSDSYEIKFSSNLDLNALFNPELDEKVVSQRLVCALENDQDFSVKHSLQRYLRGDVSTVALATPSHAREFVYLSNANFFESFDNDRSRKYISDASLRKILQAKPSIPCKIVMTIYAKQAYYSATMLMPTQDILKLLPAA